MKLKIEIKNRWTGKVIFEFETENNTVAKTINEYVRLSSANLTDADLTGANLTDADLTGANLTDADLTGANLTDADLTGADLTGANLTDADLTGANLTDADLTGADLTDADITDANLTGANLTRANLTGADLTGANLTRANLTGADLTDADLTDANLTRANLTDANLTGADLTGADLTGANLESIKADFFYRMLLAKKEINALREAIIAGKINGSCYEGDCCCFVGTIANAAGLNYNYLPLLKPNSSSATERWFMGINPGNTPESNIKSKITLDWIDEFLLLVS